MVGLRVKERVDGYEVEGEESAIEPAEEDIGIAREVDVDDYGGGFLLADEDGGMRGRERIDIHDGLRFLQPGEGKGPEPKGNVNTLHDPGSSGLGERNSSAQGEDIDDDDGGGFIPGENDSGMESEDYIDDGGGGFISE